MAGLERHPSSRRRVNWKTWWKCVSGSLSHVFSCLTVNMMFLMSYWCVSHSNSEGVEALQMALHTLRMMALGGINDHVSQVLLQISLNSFILQLRDSNAFIICNSYEETNRIMFVYSFCLNVSSGISSIFHRLLLARSSLWEDAVWPGSAGCSLHYCNTGMCFGSMAQHHAVLLSASNSSNGCPSTNTIATRDEKWSS